MTRNIALKCRGETKVGNGSDKLIRFCISKVIGEQMYVPLVREKSTVHISGVTKPSENISPTKESPKASHKQVVPTFFQRPVIYRLYSS
ncbi:unnamed protein product, partial [Medioppia subpectinata]